MKNCFCENLKSARYQKGLTQREIAIAIGVSPSTYSLYESGAREPNVKNIRKIANFLGVSANELLGIDEPPQTLAAHFEGKDYTEEELEEIRQFAEFVKNRNRKK